MVRPETEYGPDAQTDRDFESLTQKQRNAVEAILETPPDAPRVEAAEKAGVAESYIAYCEENFPHIINERRGAMQVATDGGKQTYEVELTADEAWKAIRLLPDELSERVFRQVRSNENPASR